MQVKEVNAVLLRNAAVAIAIATQFHLQMSTASASEIFEKGANNHRMSTSYL